MQARFLDWLAARAEAKQARQENLVLDTVATYQKYQAGFPHAAKQVKQEGDQV